MDRELLLEIGCEELPAAWLPSLTRQIGEVVGALLRDHRLLPEGRTETFSTPRRLTVRVDRVPGRQTDLEELVNGPPVSSSFGPDGTPTRAATGFAAKHGVEVSVLERLLTTKGEYLAFRKRLPGKAAIDVLPEVLAGTLRALTFPKLMHWDAVLDDGRGDLLFGRPIRWLLFLYGGAVVPFTIGRTAAARSGQVRDVTSGAVTYGHRVLATSGPAGRAIEVRGFEDYRTQLLENFVILDRAGRQDKIARELEAEALRLAGRVSRTVHAGSSALLEEVPDLVEYPCVIAGTFAPEFTEVLPDEVLTTTLIHHQHYFPIEDGRGTLKPAFLAVVNTEPEDERTIASNAERVVVARLRDAKFFWEADRRTALEARIDRLSTLLFHKKLGSYKEKAERVERLSAWIAREAFGADDGAVGHAATAARLAKTDLTTDMVREFPELQGTMGGIYARVEGLPEEVWKAIYFHYLPIGVEVGAQPTRTQLGKASVTWAAVSLADKLDTVVGLFASGERPTGSRDPYGLRRAAQGVLKTLADVADLAGVKARIAVGTLLDQALRGFGKQKPTGPVEPESSDWECWLRLSDFFAERMRHLLEERGRAYDEVNAVVDLHISPDDLVPATALARAAALAEARMSPEFDALAELFKRVKNISRGVDFGLGWAGLTDYADRESSDAAEKELVHRVIDREGALQRASAEGDYTGALKLIAGLKPYVERYFADVLVMHEDSAIRTRRLQLMAGLRDLVTAIADISEIVPKNPAVPLPAGASRSG